MKKKTLRVAAAGSTASDGRQIKAEWLSDIADTYDPKTYGARCWMEHRRSITNDGFFPALGDVVSVYTQTDKINGENTLCLYATIEALPNLVAMNKDRQKIYTSIEVQPNFANTEKAYLMGLAFTDSPASLGTEALKFNAYVTDNSSHIFTAGMETELKDIADVLAEFSQSSGAAGFVYEAFKELQKTVAELSTAFAAFQNEQSQKAQSQNEQSQNEQSQKAQSQNVQSQSEQSQNDDSDAGNQAGGGHDLQAAFAAQLSEALKPLTEQLGELTAFKKTLETQGINHIAQHDGNGGNADATAKADY